MDELLGIHRKFSHLIKDTFRDDPAFISALDKVSHLFMSVYSDTKSTLFTELGVLYAKVRTNWFQSPLLFIEPKVCT